MSFRSVSLFLALLTVVANLAVVSALVLTLGRRVPSLERAGRALRSYVRPHALATAWIVAAISTAGSLYLSEVGHLPPCTLCWYQRIAMYPLVLILAIAAFRRDGAVRRYVLPLVAGGALISIYHYQLQRFPRQSSLACALDTPCTAVWVWRFHYISIPFMALSAFALIALLVLIAGRSRPHDTDEPSTAATLETVGGTR
jgi:disulfide bond formation protein DsbB